MGLMGNWQYPVGRHYVQQVGHCCKEFVDISR